MFEEDLPAWIADQDDAASEPDPDNGPCEDCGGGMAHFPECPIFDRLFAR